MPVTSAFGPCIEYLLKNGKHADPSCTEYQCADAHTIADVLSNLVFLAEADRPAGVLAEVLRTVSSMIVSLDERFLVHTGVHKAVIRLLRTCAGDELQERIDGRVKNRNMGAAGAAVRQNPSEYEEDRKWRCCYLPRSAHACFPSCRSAVYHLWQDTHVPRFAHDLLP